MIPIALVDEYNERGEKDDGSYFVFIRFSENLHFLDFGFNNDISRLFNINYGEIVKNFNGYKSGKEYFFKDLNQANLCADFINKIIIDMFSENLQKQGFKNIFLKMFNKEVRCLKKCGYTKDAELLLNYLPEYLSEMLL